MGLDIHKQTAILNSMTSSLYLTIFTRLINYILYILSNCLEKMCVFFCFFMNFSPRNFICKCSVRSISKLKDSNWKLATNGFPVATMEELRYHIDFKRGGAGSEDQRSASRASAGWIQKNASRSEKRHIGHFTALGSISALPVHFPRVNPCHR